jgi:hypothetical protein
MVTLTSTSAIAKLLMVLLNVLSLRVQVIDAFSSTPTSASTNANHHVIVGTGSLEVQLITAKLAIRYGDTCSIIGQSDSKFVSKCTNLMYGVKKDNDGDNGSNDDNTDNNNISDKNNLPEFISDGESISQALAKADDIIIVCEEKAVDDQYIQTLLSNSPKIKHLALLSRQGGKFKSMEDSIRKKCQAFSNDNGSDNETRDIAFSVLRAGNLVGGGPGPVDKLEDEGEGKVEDFGLSKFFYDTKYDLSDAMITMSMDKFTMGAKITPGDPFKAPNFFSKMMSNNSFEPRDGDTGRTAAAHALLAAVRRSDGDGVKVGVDVSISTEKSKKPLSFEEWDILLEKNS